MGGGTLYTRAANG